MAGDGGGSYFAYVTGEDADRAKRKFKKGRVFVITPFRPKAAQKTYSVIQEECSKLGLFAARSGEVAGAGIVILEITRLIREAELIICDLTYERPNVYWELGYAQGVGNGPQDIILIAKEGTALHFDVSSLQVRYYRSNKDLRSIISSQIMGLRNVEPGITAPRSV